MKRYTTIIDQLSNTPMYFMYQLKKAIRDPAAVYTGKKRKAHVVNDSSQVYAVYTWLTDDPLACMCIG